MRHGYYNRGLSVEQRFWLYVKKTDSCWEWTGNIFAGGYGRLATEIQNKHVRAHRLAWQLTNGPIPKGMFVCHHCDNRKCVRPDHLFLGTQKDNAQDALKKGRLRFPNLSGEDHPQAKLTWAKVRNMRALFWESTEPLYTTPMLAKGFNMSESQVKNIVNFRHWIEQH